MSRIRLFIFVTTIVVVSVFGYIISLYARGFRFDPDTLQFIPKGLFVANSDPNGAEIFIDGELKTATDATLSLAPGTYDVRLEREGYLAWSKRLVVEEEIVTQIDASLFPTAASLSPLTFNGAFSPTPSPDFTKIAYGVPPADNGDENGSQNALASDRHGLWVAETVNLPIGFNREPRQITDRDVTGGTWQWSPDSGQIMLSIPNQAGAEAVFILEVGDFTPQNQMINVAGQKEAILAQWKEEAAERLSGKLSKLPGELVEIFERKTTDILFSPDEKKILYTATESVTIPEGVIPTLPGSSTQVQEREIVPGRKYVFDTREDRNFLVVEGGQDAYWFPTSAHVVVPEGEQVVIMDYDGTNKQVVFSGSYVTPHGYPYANTNQLLILTNLGSNGASPNLYTLNLR